MKQWRNISLKVSLNDVDEDNKTALLYAIRFINHEAIHELLQAGADPNIQDRHGKTALMYTTNQHFIYFLLEYGADGRIKDHEGKTIFDNPYFHNFAPCHARMQQIQHSFIWQHTKFIRHSELSTKMNMQQ